MDKLKWKVSRVIDAHSHYLGAEPVTHYNALLEQAGHTHVNIIANFFPNCPDYLQFALDRKKEQPDRFFIFGSMQHDSEKIAQGDGRYLAEQVKSLMARGFDGIKALEGKPSFRREWMRWPFDHEYYRPFFDTIAELDVPYTVHTSDPIDFWSTDSMNSAYRDFLPQEEYFRQVIAVLERYPNLRITCAHFMYLSSQLNRLAKLFERFPRLRIDLAPGSEFLYYLSDDAKRAREFFIKWQDRILYGTDLSDRNSMHLGRAKVNNVRLFLQSSETFFNQTELSSNKPPQPGSNGRTELHGIDLPQDVLEKVLHQNFEAFVGVEPKPLPA